MQLWMLDEPGLESPALEVVESFAVKQKEAADRIRPTITGDVFTHFIDDRIEEPHDVEVIGDEPRVREHFAGELFKRVTHIQNDVFHPFALGNMFQIVHQSVGGFAFNNLEDLFVVVVDKDRREVRGPKAASERVFIDPDGGGPGIISAFPEFHGELFVVDLINEPCRATVGLLNAFQIEEVITSPANPGSKTLGRLKAFSYTGYRFSEDLFALRAAEPALEDRQIDPASPDGLIFDLYPAPVMNCVTLNRAFRAHLKVRLLGAAVLGSKFITLPVCDNFQFWQEHEFGVRFPIGIHSQTSTFLKIEASVTAILRISICGVDPFSIQVLTLSVPL